MGMPPLPLLDGARHELSAAGEHVVHTSLLIEAPAALVWQVLTDFERMPRWSSSLLSVQGPWQDGAAVVVWQQLMGEAWVQPQVLKLQPGVGFGWSSWWHGDYSRVRDDHWFELQPLAPALTRVVQRDRFHGPDAAALGAPLARAALADYAGFNRALRDEVMARSLRKPPELQQAVVVLLADLQAAGQVQAGIEPAAGRPVGRAIGRLRGPHDGTDL
ncbi:MAG: hypothetical protein DI603_07755 [Roseateles depolymerans]|uniref:Uncharacterized protein n=1 Tax=Roseateles depolymerans TaxID=76731 RepID=A0A2W5FK34_9BURK|nr:MAG: hypothetical protein DI603_07755 [Roseateles depolymerans]